MPVRGMDATLAFRLGDSLNAVNTRFEFHNRVHFVARYLELDFLVAACFGRRDIHSLHFPAMMVGKAQVHLIQIASKNCRFVAAGGCTNFNNDVLLVSRVRGDKHELDVFLKLRELAFDTGNLFLSEFLHIGVREHFLSLCQIVKILHVLASSYNKRTLVGIALCKLIVFMLVGKNLRITQLLLQLFVRIDDLLKLFAHVLPFRISIAGSTNQPTSTRL